MPAILSPRASRRRGLLLALAAGIIAPRFAAADTWDNSSNNGGAWSTIANWADNSEPTSADPVIFPTPIPFGDSTVSLSTGEQCQSITFNDSYSLGAGNVQLFATGGPITVASGKTATISSSIIGSVGLNKGGSGTLVLSPTGSNTFTGEVDIVGTLSITKDTSLGNAANAVVIGPVTGGAVLTNTVSLTTSRTISPGIFGGAIRAGAGTNFTINGALGGVNNPLTFDGAGTVILGAASTRNGSTTIQNGTVRLNNGSAFGTLGCSVSSNGTLEIAAGLTSGAFATLNNTATLRTNGVGAVDNGGVNVASAATVTFNTGDLATHTLTVSDVDGGSGGGVAIVNGPGTLILNGSGNTFAGQWVVAAGTLRLSNADAITTSSSPVTIGIGGTVIAETASNYPGQWTVNGLLRAQNASATGTAASTANVGISGTLQIESVSLIGNAALNSGGTIKGIGIAGIGGTTTAGTATSTITLATGATATDTLAISNYTGGTGSATHVAGSGTVILPHASTYAGGWEIDSGTLRVDHASALGTSSFPVVVNGGTLQIHGGVVLTRDIAMNNGSTLKGGPLDGFFNDAFAFGTVSVASGAQVNFAGTTDGCELRIGNEFNGALSGGGGGANITVSAGEVRLGCPATYTGGWVINNALLVVGNDNQLGNLLNAVTFAGPAAELGVSAPVTTSRQLNLNSTANRFNLGSTLTINSGLAGSAGTSLLIYNPGTLVLNAAGTWNGSLATIGPSATVKVNQSAALGTTPLSVDNATLELGGGVALGQSLQLHGLGVLRGNNNAAYNGTITVVDAGSNDDVTLATVSAGDVFTIGNGLNDLTGGGSGSTITAAGPGTIVLPQSNNYTGDWIVSGGTLQIGAGDPLGNVGVVSVNAGATFSMVGAFVTDSAVLLNNNGTLRATGASSIAGSDHLRIANGATNVFINVPGVGDAISISAAVRNDLDGASSATVHFSGAGRLSLQSGGISAADIFGGSWEQSGGILQVGFGGGSSINALGFKNGDAKQANTITINGGTMAVSAVGSGANTPTWLRANVILNGGAIAGMSTIDPQFGGDFVVSAGSSSRVLVFDLATDAARNVTLLAGAAGTDNLAGATTWGAGSTLTVDPGATSGGVFNIARDGGTITVGNPAPTLHINSGATLGLGGTADALSDGTNHVNVVKDVGGGFAVTQGSKNIGSLSGSGATSIFGGASLTVHQDVNTSTASITGLGAFVKQGSGTLTCTVVDAGSLTINAGGLIALSVIDNGTLNVNAGSMTADLLAVGNDGTLTGGSGTGTATISGGTVSAKKVLLGSSAGGNGTLRVQTGGTLASEKLAANALVVNGGTVTISTPSAPDDPVIDGSLVAGYVHDGSVNLNVGSITTPNVKLGVTAGKTGTITLNGGTLNVTTLGVGNDGTAGGGAGVGTFVLNGGQVNATSIVIGSSAGGIGEMTLGSTNPEKVLKVATLSIDNGAGNKLDVTDNKLIVTAGAVGTFSGGGYSGLSGKIASAYDFGAWDGAGVTTSILDAAAGLTTLAIAEAGQLGIDTFGGIPVSNGDVLVMYTYAGDANLDGTIDGGDYGIIDNFAQIPGASGYANGDFNYDGAIDGGDYGIIDNNIQAQGPPFSTSASSMTAVTAVPEPVGVALLVAPFGYLLRRHRRREACRRAT